MGADNKGNSSWIVWVLVVVAVVFVVLALKKERSQVSAVPAVDVLADRSGDVKGTIKPPHTMADQLAVNNVKTSPAVVVPLQVVESKDVFAIQVYSFKDKDRADTALEKLKAQGFNNSYIMTSDLGARGIWYRVRVGQFSNEGQAQAVLEKITASFMSGIIVKE